MDEMRSSGPRTVQFLLQGEHTQTRFGGAVGVSFALHVATMILAVFVATRSLVEEPAAINPKPQHGTRGSTSGRVGAGGGRKRSPEPPQSRTAGQRQIRSPSSIHRPQPPKPESRLLADPQYSDRDTGPR